MKFQDEIKVWPHVSTLESSAFCTQWFLPAFTNLVAFYSTTGFKVCICPGALSYDHWWETSLKCLMKRQTVQDSSHTHLISFLRRKHQALTGFKMHWGQERQKPMARSWSQDESKWGDFNSESVIQRNDDLPTHNVFRERACLSRRCAILTVQFIQKWVNCVKYNDL